MFLISNILFLIQLAESSLEIEIITQRSYLLEEYQEAYNLYFKASIDNRLASCVSSDATFISELASSFEGLTTPRGVAITLISIDAVTKSHERDAAFSIYLHSLIARKDIGKVESALAEVWKIQKSSES